MNVLFISRNSPFESIGGIERYITNLIEYYKAKSGTNFYLMLPTDKGPYVEKHGNVTIYFDPSIALSKSKLNVQREISIRAQTFYDSVQTIVKSNSIEIICAENLHTDLPAAFALLLNMAAISLKIPLVLQIHSFASTELQIELINQLKWDQISCISKSVSGDCYHKGADIDRISTHYLGVDTKKFNTNINASANLKEQLQLPSETKIILTASRIIRGTLPILKEKGLIDLIQAFSKLSPRYPNLKMLIAVGKTRVDLQDSFNQTLERLRGYIKLHNIEANTIIKMFELDEMPDVYRGSDVFVLPSENETFGQVFIEAMACGTPVIGTKVGGVPEIISDSYNGFLVQPADPSILAQKIERVLNDTSMRNKMISAGVKTVNNIFTTEKQLSDFEKMLAETVGANEKH